MVFSKCGDKILCWHNESVLRIGNVGLFSSYVSFELKPIRCLLVRICEGTNSRVVTAGMAYITNWQTRKQILISIYMLGVLILGEHTIDSYDRELEPWIYAPRMP